MKGSIHILLGLLLVHPLPTWTLAIEPTGLVFDYSPRQPNPLRRHVDQTPPAPPNTCPVHEQPVFINQNNENFTVDINWHNRHGMAGYFTVHVDPLQVTAEPGGSEATARGVRISPPYTVRAFRTGPPAGVHVGPHDQFVEIQIDSNAATTPNFANHEARYAWAGIWPRVTMRVTQESYRGRLHQSWRIQWLNLIRGAIAVFLVHGRGHAGCG